jgi:hypothetical protein
VDKLKTEAGTYRALCEVLQDVNVSSLGGAMADDFDDNDDDNGSRQTAINQKGARLLARYIHTEGQVRVGKPSDVQEWVQMVDAYSRNGARTSEKARATYDRLASRPNRNSSIRDMVAFWCSRSGNEGWKALAQDPYAGFKLGIGDMMYLPMVQLREDEAVRLLQELQTIVNTVVTHGLFVAQLKLAQTLNAAEEMAYFADPRVIAWLHDDEDEDDVLLAANDLNMQWAGLSATPVLPHN